MPATPSLRPDTVFVDNGVPTATYVSVNNGELEKKLTKVVEWRQNAHVAGPSKTGKSVLIARVLRQLERSWITVPCTGSLLPKDVWALGLEKLAYERVATRRSGHEGAIHGEVETPTGPFGLLADWIGRAKLGLSAKASEDVARERVLADPTAHHIVQALKHDGSVFVLENVHLLQSSTLEAICHGLREFDAEELSAILVSARPGITRAAIRAADLAGRTADVDVSTWSVDDLKNIVRLGFKALRLTISEENSSHVAYWSAGLPIVAQQCCRELLAGDLGGSARPRKSHFWSARDVADAMHAICDRYYTFFQEVFDLFAGPLPEGVSEAVTIREAVLRAFEVFPLRPSLNLVELRSRIRDIKTAEPSSDERIDSAIDELLQDDAARGEEPLFEWRDRDRTLRIADPSFHFYIAWGRNRRDDEITVPA